MGGMVPAGPRPGRCPELGGGVPRGASCGGLPRAAGPLMSSSFLPSGHRDGALADSEAGATAAPCLWQLAARAAGRPSHRRRAAGLTVTVRRWGSSPEGGPTSSRLGPRGGRLLSGVCWPAVLGPSFRKTSLEFGNGGRAGRPVQR